MKLKIHKTLAAVFTVALTVIGFTAHAENIPGVVEQPASYFYTGKPYDSDLGAYVFNARNYNPEINRWTSTDPSGFIDGANNTIYAPTPTIELDANGLWKISLTSERIFNEAPDGFNVTDSLGRSIPFFTSGSASSSIYAGTPSTSGSISAYASASYLNYGSNDTTTADVNISAAIAVDNNGQLSITRNPGAWSTPSSDASVGTLLTWSTSNSGKSLTVEYSYIGGYSATGLNGIGLSSQILGISLGYTGSTGVSQGTVVGTFTFSAVE